MIGFSDPYLSTGLALLVGAKSEARSLTDLDQTGKTLVVRLGTTGETWARPEYPECDHRCHGQGKHRRPGSNQGKADAFIYDQMSVWQNQQKNPDTTRALLAPIRKEEWAIAVRKDDEALRAQINAFLKKFRAEGGFDRLAPEFLKDQKDGVSEAGYSVCFLGSDQETQRISAGVDYGWGQGRWPVRRFRSAKGKNGLSRPSPRTQPFGDGSALLFRHLPNGETALSSGNPLFGLLSSCRGRLPAGLCCDLPRHPKDILDE